VRGGVETPGPPPEASVGVRAVAGGTELDVWLQPRASRDEISGVQGGALKIRVAAAPVEGEANEALLRLLAKCVGLPRSSVEIVRGRTGRRKTVRLAGLAPAQVRRELGLTA
jgi:uncharacterized protein